MGGGADWGWARFLSFDWVEAGDGACGARRSGVYGGEVVFVDQRKKIVIGRVIEDVFVPAVLDVKAFNVSATIAKQSNELAVVRTTEEEEDAWSIGGSGLGAPGKYTLVEDDVGGGGDAPDFAEEDVEGTGSINGASKVDACIAASRVVSLPDVGGVDCSDGSTSKRHDGEEVGYVAVESSEGGAAGLLYGRHAVVDVDGGGGGVDPVLDARSAG